MPIRGYPRSQQAARSNSSEGSSNTNISTRSGVSRSRDNTRNASRTNQDQLATPNIGTQFPIFGQHGIPFRNDISYIDETKLRTIEKVMAQAVELSKIRGLNVDPFTDAQVSLWNHTWGTNLKRNTLKSAMDKFQEFKASFASPEPWTIDNEDSDPITKLICLYRNMMAAGKYSEVFNMILEEATELYERFHVDGETQLHQSLSVVANDAVLAEYAVAAKLLTRWNMYNAEWANFAGWCLGEISLREDARTWSGPTSNIARPVAIPQSLAADLSQWEGIFGTGAAEESSALSKQNGALDPRWMNILGEAGERETSSVGLGKRRRENDEETLEDFGGHAISAKRLMTSSNNPRAKPARVTTALQERFGIPSIDLQAETELLDSGRPREPAEWLTSRNRHPRAEVTEAAPGTEQDDIFSMQDQPNVGRSDDHEEVQEHPETREISPFFFGEQDPEL